MTKLLNFFDGQWGEAYQRIGDNGVKPQDIWGLDTKKEAKAAGETVQPQKTKPPPFNQKTRNTSHHNGRKDRKKTRETPATKSSATKASPESETVGTGG